jgi:hypothetical protein
MNKDKAANIQKQIDNGELVFDRERIVLTKTGLGIKSLLEKYLEKKSKNKK